MNKLWIAGIAFAASTTMVAAEVNFSGYGRFGLQYDEGADETAGEDEVRLESRFRLNIDAIVESDAGVTFEARVRLQADDNADGTADTASLNGARFEARSGGLRVQVGNIAGVFDDESTVLFFGYEPGLIDAIGHYSTFQGPIVEYDSTGSGVNGVSVLYEAGPFAIMANYNDETSDAPEATEVGVAYSFGDYTVAVGYGTQDSSADDIEYYVATFDGTIGDFDFSLFVGDDDVGDEVAYGASGRYQIAAATQVIASVAAGGGDDLDEAFGVGFRHDLGGGASFRGMVGQNEEGDGIADLGVRFDF